MVQVSLASFVAGPEPEGRGYGMLAHTGLSGNLSWEGSFPLVLLEWAKRHSSEGFCGRFPVAGGTLLIRAAYLGEGSAGPVAHAAGVFIETAQLESVLVAERNVIGHLPVPDGTQHFGEQLLVLDLPAHVDPKPITDLGLAWADLHIFVDEPISLEEVALASLESITPPTQRARVRGWCTTGLLASRGDFLPIRDAGLLVTRPAEPLQHERFLSAWVNAQGELRTNDHAAPPAAYIVWNDLKKAARSYVPPNAKDDLHDRFAWSMPMAGWTLEELSWHYVGLLSHYGLSYLVMASAICAIGGPGDAERNSAGARAMGQYLLTVAQHDPQAVADLAELFRTRIPNDPVWRSTLNDFILDHWPGTLIAKFDHADLFDLIVHFEQRVRHLAKTSKGSPGWHSIKATAYERLDALYECSMALSRGPDNRDRRERLAMAFKLLDALSRPGDPAVPRGEALKRLKRRMTMPKSVTGLKR